MSGRNPDCVCVPITETDTIVSVDKRVKPLQLTGRCCPHFPIRVLNKTKLRPNKTVKAATGIKAKVPDGMLLVILPIDDRSLSSPVVCRTYFPSQGVKEITIALLNNTNVTQSIPAGKKVAKMVLMKDTGQMEGLEELNAMLDSDDE